MLADAMLVLIGVIIGAFSMLCLVGVLMLINIWREQRARKARWAFLDRKTQAPKLELPKPSKNGSVIPFTRDKEKK